MEENTTAMYEIYSDFEDDVQRELDTILEDFMWGEVADSLRTSLLGTSAHHAGSASTAQRSTGASVLAEAHELTYAAERSERRPADSKSDSDHASDSTECTPTTLRPISTSCARTTRCVGEAIGEDVQHYPRFCPMDRVLGSLVPARGTGPW
eukprot:CAMPEP_0118954472 /NCGR_PEP_ID=MMETSP1169-20130426/58267_1 /TAXON_ID=36882 /ORGANISM="Pyramimonas obovata, Strain CCMP722" /LENGTH=151 /DNA_ID=CAMNT_0006902103 /DNA_START=286 /DNA_END=738 /DNA_ORIENTATION=-